MAVQTGRVLIVEGKRGWSLPMQGTLRDAGYTPVATSSAARALHLLKHRDLDLVVVAGSTTKLLRPKDTRHTTRSGGSRSTDSSANSPYELCRVLKSGFAGQPLPLLLVVPAWHKSAMLRGLEAGTDYLLLAPYQPQTLLGIVRTALLNCVAAAPCEPGVDLILEDRFCTLPGERGRLCRILLSVYEDLLSTKSLLAWQQAEVVDLREKLRRERHETGRVALVNEMVQGVAHDFANLLETVGAAAGLLTSSSPNLGRYRSSFESALAQAESLIAILQNCSPFDDEKLPLEPVDVRKAVEVVLQSAVLELRAPLVRVAADVRGLPPMQTNATVLTRCLNNLVWNAVQAMPSGGVLEITGSVVEGRVVLQVADTGSGISREVQEKVFEKHISTKQGHRGMGLALVRSLVRRTGGEVMLIDRPGFGATFAHSFPVAARALGSPRTDGCAERTIEVRQTVQQTEA